MKLYEYMHVDISPKNSTYEDLHDLLLDNSSGWDVYATHAVGRVVVYVLRREVS